MVINYSKKAIKFLKSLDKKSVERIRNAINGLTQTPPVGDIKVMQGSSDGKMRLSVGTWRVIYKYGINQEVEVLFILEIGNRGDIYK